MHTNLMAKSRKGRCRGDIIVHALCKATGKGDADGMMPRHIIARHLCSLQRTEVAGPGEGGAAGLDINFCSHSN